VIVMSSGRDTGNPILRQWLRNERRLGIPHYAVAPGSATPPPKQSPPRAETPPATPKPAPPAPKPARSAAPAALFGDAPDLPPLCPEDLAVTAAEAALQALDRDFVQGCERCRLCEKRTQTVFGVGHARPDLVFVGEGPGADEDAKGEPFVGRAGQLLTKMIAAMTLTREQVYICNVVKCRPPGNRTPSEDEMQTCSPFLVRQLAILRPKVIVTLGRPASQSLLATKTPISKLRGSFHEFPPPALAHLQLPTAQLMPTFHPAYLLRNPPAKKEAWEDLQQVMQALNIKPAT
jgi:uracil-DNA glycosylase family 4